jgi:tRNA(Arg) A34 adenosine deaminase TadA
MCFGAIHWSGIRRLIVSAAKSDVEQIGFDEGPIPADWREKLESGGIKVVSDCCRAEGKAVLQSYLQAGSTIYNASGRKRESRD